MSKFTLGMVVQKIATNGYGDVAVFENRQPVAEAKLIIKS
jgi:hypothetical protein